MADPASLANSQVSQPDPELHETTIRDDATGPGQEIRCLAPWLGVGLATDPMAWQPVTTAAGEYWPKEGDRCLVTAQLDGPPLIAWWEPAEDAEPDAAIEGGGEAPVVSVFGRDGEVEAEADDYSIGQISGAGTAAGKDAGKAGEAGKVLNANDPTTADSRTPKAHKSTHATGGTDVLAPSDIGAATTAALGDEEAARIAVDTSLEEWLSEAVEDLEAADAKRIVGPSSSKSLNFPIFFGTDGKLVVDSGVAISEDGTFAAGSAAKIPTEKATKTYISSVSGLLIPKSLIDAKGDLIVGTADDTPSRLAVGSNGQVLTADSAKTEGVKWAAPEAGPEGKAGQGMLACRLATTAALAAYTRTENKIEANANGAMANVDGVAVAENDVLLLGHGAATKDNGPWKVTSLGGAGSKFKLERVPEMDSSAECIPGMLLTVAEGTKNGDRQFSLTTDGPIVLNTTGLTFAPTCPKDLGLLSEPPTSKALVGDICHLWADKSNGIIWEFIYTGEGEAPWSFQGGPALYVWVNTDQERSTNSYGDLATAGPKVTAPFKGDYMPKVGALGYPGTGALVQGVMSYEVGATAPKDEDGARFDGNANSEAVTASSPPRVKTVAAGTVFTAKYRSFSSNSAHFTNRWIRIKPTRVG
jgi:hypothetical protein